MEFKDDGKPKKMTWRFFRPAPKPKPEPSVAPPKIVLIPSTGIPSPTQNTQNAPPHQKPAPTLGSPSQPKRGPISGNQMERGKISGEPESGLRKTANLGPKQATEIPSPTQNPQNAQRISTGIHQKPVSTIGSPLQPKRGPITGNPNQMERGKISGEPESGPCCLCQFYRRPCIKHDTSYLMKMFL